MLNGLVGGQQLYCRGPAVARPMVWRGDVLRSAGAAARPGPEPHHHTHTHTHTNATSAGGPPAVPAAAGHTHLHTHTSTHTRTLQGADLQAWYCDFSRNTAGVGAGLTVRDPQSSAELNFCTLWQNGADGEAVPLPLFPKNGLFLSTNSFVI